MRGINKDEIAEQLAKLEDYKKRKMDTSNN